jgi:hypothetical protein
MKNNRLLKISAFCISACMLGRVACAQQSSPSAKPAGRATPESRVDFGQNTTNDTVVAREVTWPGKTWSKHVFFSKKSGEAIVISDTNAVCALKGRLYGVYPGVQEFWIRPSSPIGTNELSSQAAVALADESISRPIFGPEYRHVDLKLLLAVEQERHLAAPLFLNNVTIGTKGADLVVRFESYTGLRGTVVVDRDLNIVSQTLDSNSAK